MRPRWRAFVLLSLLALGAGAAVPAGERAARPVLVQVEVGSRSELRTLAGYGSVDRVDGSRVWLVTSPSGVEELARRGFHVAVLPDPGLKPGVRMGLAALAATGQWDAYPSYPGYVAMMQGFAAAHPEICRLVDFGNTTNTVRPHKLLALKISDNPDSEEDEPEVFLTSSMHGDELVGAVNLLHLADELLAHYDPLSTDPYDQEITRLVSSLEIWINPLANPDGTYYASDDSVNGAIRYFTTTSGLNSAVDPNRNFPDPADGDHPDGHSWWSETQAMMALAEAHSFVLSVNFHGGAEVVNYPWDTWLRRHPDDSWYQTLAHAYADQAQADGPPSYMTDLDDGTTNGYDWYRVTGGRQDFMNYWYGCREVTIELSHGKIPDPSALPTYWTANRQALLNFLATAVTGVRGIVTDPDGVPLAATIEIPGHDADGSWVYTDPAVGDYHRLLPPGTYDLRVSADGFFSREVPGIVVTGGDASRRDVVLYPEGPGADIFADGFDDGTTSAWSAVVGASGARSAAVVAEDCVVCRGSQPVATVSFTLLDRRGPRGHPVTGKRRRP